MKGKKVFVFLFLLMCFVAGNTTAQTSVTISGTVADSTGMPIAGANVVVEHLNKGAITTEKGYYALNLTPGQVYTMIISHIGYATQQKVIDLTDIDSKNHESQVTGSIDHQHVDITLHDTLRHIPEVAVMGKNTLQGNMQRVDIKEIRQLPNPAGGIETLIKTLPGVSSNNELSSQYSVRGGNFDENLVYVNDVEIHRPLLIRSGQQEGLSFINPDLVASVDFSAGGFDARYGDKMSSVLDVQYRTPTAFAGNASVSLLNASASVEGRSIQQRFSYLAGVRYKTSQYLLGTLDTKGDYHPDFFDVQSLFRYQISNTWDVDLLVNVARNKYHFVPESRTTTFGTLYEAYHLQIYYDGQEVDHYNNGLGALTFNYRPTGQLLLKFTGSAYKAHEQETFDIEGAYLLHESTPSISGDSTINIGIRSELQHARNYLDATIYSFSHTGTWNGGNRSFRWSIAYQQETTDNRFNEWVMVDSAGYSIPYHENMITLKDSRRANNHLEVHRLTSYLQYKQQFSGERANWILTAGMRLNYNHVNQEWLLSPRASIAIRPKNMENLTGYLSAGMYGQPPTYRELRDARGNMNLNMKAQRSVHYVLGGSYDFHVGQRPFRLSSEIYYKHLNRLVPYRMENVRIYYAGDNLASGYVAGWDVKLNGEFVENAESWISISLMHAREDIKEDGYGSFPLPTDQWINMNLYFQDYIPGVPTWRMFLNLVYGSPLPYSSPNPIRYDQFFRMSSYRRVDIGLSKEFFKKEKPHKFFKQVWCNMEVFNLFDTNNTISYLWVEVASNQQYAVPNYLTGRRLNVKLSATF